MKLRSVILSFLILCGFTASASAQALYHTPSDFITGVVGFQVNDNIADNLAMQGCLNASSVDGLPCQLGPGVHDIESRANNLSLGNPRRTMALEIFRNKKPVTIKGVGPETVIRMLGPGYGADWWMIACYESAGVNISDVTLDGSGRTSGFAEQQHLFNAHYGCKNINIQRVVVIHPMLAPAGGGDCLRFVGNGPPPSAHPSGTGAVINTGTGLSFNANAVFGATNREGEDAQATMVAPGPTVKGKLQWIGGVNRLVIEGYLGQDPSAVSLAGADYWVTGADNAHLVENVLVRDVRAVNCDRSVIALQRGVGPATFEQIVAVGTGDQDFDMEATGVATPRDRIHDIVIRDFYAIRPIGGLSLSIGRGDRLRVENGYVLNGGAFVLSCTDCSMVNSWVSGDMTTNPALSIYRATPGLVIDNVTVIKPAGSGHGAAVTASGDINGYPKYATIRNSKIVQNTISPGVMVQNGFVDVQDTLFEYLGGTADIPGTLIRYSNAVAVVYNAIVQPAGGKVTFNRFIGPWYTAANATANSNVNFPDAKLGPFRFIGNEINGPKRALFCEGPVAKMIGIIRGLNVVVDTTSTPVNTTLCPQASTSGY